MITVHDEKITRNYLNQGPGLYLDYHDDYHDFRDDYHDDYLAG